MWKYRKKWVKMLMILGQEGADLRMLGKIFKAVMQAALIFGSEMWVVTPRVSRKLGGFQHRLARHMTRKQPWCMPELIWD